MYHLKLHRTSYKALSHLLLPLPRVRSPTVIFPQINKPLACLLVRKLVCESAKPYKTTTSITHTHTHIVHTHTHTPALLEDFRRSLFGSFRRHISTLHLFHNDMMIINNITRTPVRRAVVIAAKKCWLTACRDANVATTSTTTNMMMIMMMIKVFCFC